MARFSGKQYRGAMRDLRAANRAEAEARQRKSEQYAALDTIAELGSDDPAESWEAVRS